VKVVISQGLIYTKPGNMVRKLGKSRGNYQQNRGKLELSHSSIDTESASDSALMIDNTEINQ